VSNASQPRRAVLVLAAAALTRCFAVAQQLRRIAVLSITAAEADRRIAAFERALRAAGWTPGGNIHIEYRRFEADRSRMRSVASEIVALAPEVILAQSTPMTLELLQLTRTIPVVFVHVSDPVGDGIVASFAQPSGNATGFTDIDAAMGSKWLQLLREVAPSVTRAGLLFNPETAPRRGEFFLGPFIEAGASLSIAAAPAAVRDASEIEARLNDLVGGGGLVVAAESFVGSRSAEIVALAAKLRVPAVYASRHHAERGGLISYGIDSPDLFRRAASYVDRILRGAKPGDLPVQQPTKFELVVNLKTAAALGITVPPALLARADEVIE
jgi:putative tryptophan/tyrosine transport system substrate-binding protein